MLTYHARVEIRQTARFLPSLGVFALLVGLCQAGDWPRWRGPKDNGSTQSGSYPVEWDAEKGLAWKVRLSGKGCSTPIVWQKRVYLTAPVEGHDALLALDWDGKALWQTRLGPERPGKHRNASGSNPSPATDGRSLFAYFRSGTLAALDLEGKVRWQTNLQRRFGRDTLYWDIGTSPVLTGADVVVAVMQEGGSYLVAFDQLTGQLRWKVAREFRTPLEADHSYTTPLVYQERGKEALLVWGAEHLTSHSTADGKTLWTCGGFNPGQHANWVAVSSPVIAQGVAVVPFGRGNTLHGIRLGGTGDVTETHRVWMRDDTGSFVPTPAEYQGRVYLLRDRGQIECVDPATGKTLASGQLPRKSPNFYASPLVADGKLYAAREDGVVFVVRLDDKFKLLAENNLGERLIASPVPSGNRLLLRGDKHLFVAEAQR